MTPAIGLHAFGIARARASCASALRICGGSMLRVALADQDQRLAPFLERSHVDDQRLDAPTATPGCGSSRRFPSGSARSSPRTRSSARSRTCGRRTAGGRATTAAWLRVMRTDAVDSSGYITPIMSDGPSCVSTNCASWLAHRQARAAPHVVVVEEDREQPDVVARRFGFLVVVGADLARRLLDRVGDAAVELDQLEGLDLLRLAVLGRPRSRSA